MATVFIPPGLRPFTKGQATVVASGGNVGDVIKGLDERFPGIARELCEGERLRPGLAVVVGGSVRPLGVLQPVSDRDEVHFLPAVGGG